jgi:hypothetical protein
MASRGDMIKRARARVDARREARNRANIRDEARATYGRNLGKRRFAPTEPSVGSGGDKLLEIISGAGGDLKRTGENIADKTGEGIMGVYDAGAKFVKSLMSNIDRSAQNREILGDAYTDDLRKSMMTDDDLDFYNKYVELADLASDNQERDRLMGIANTAMQNAQITNRINYALGQPEFGFETTAPAGVANIDYSTLADRMVGGTDDSVGLEGSAVGKEFLKRAYEAQTGESGDSMLGNALKNYGQRDVLLDMNVPYKDEFMDQFDIAEALTPMQKYLLQSKAQGKGGYEPDSEQAMIDAGFDMDYIGPLTQMKIFRYP